MHPFPHRNAGHAAGEKPAYARRFVSSQNDVYIYYKPIKFPRQPPCDTYKTHTHFFRASPQIVKKDPQGACVFFQCGV